MIPKVRLWKVNYYVGRRLVFSTIVRTINKQFAKWGAQDKVRSLLPAHRLDLSYADRQTVSVIKESK